MRGERRTRERCVDEAMDRYSDGDARAFHAVYAGTARRVHGYLVRLVRDRALADDLLQVTYMRLHVARGAWRHGAPLMPWLLTIARNAAFDDRRARKSSRLELTRSGDVPELGTGAEDDGPDAAVEEALRLAIERLPPKYREALILTKHRDLTLREAASAAGATEMAMKLRVHRAYERLRAEIALPARVEVSRRFSTKMRNGSVATETTSHERGVQVIARRR